MTARRLPSYINPGAILVGHFDLTHGAAWIAHLPHADEIELDGCFTAPELRRFADVLEGKPA